MKLPVLKNPKIYWSAIPKRQQIFLSRARNFNAKRAFGLYHDIYLFEAMLDAIYETTNISDAAYRGTLDLIFSDMDRYIKPFFLQEAGDVFRE